jgi:hypothetical protein
MLPQANKKEIFISKAKKIHGDRYDYSKVKYINAKTKITIICSDHGEFQQTPSNHLCKFNCQKCSNNLKLDTITFIEKARKVHGDRYDYSKVNYINSGTKVIIICSEHGDFEQIPDFHINRKCNCPKCINNIVSNVDEFIKKSNKIHKNKYDYSFVIYINSKTPVKIICVKHGEFYQTPDLHINQLCGCPHCINKTEFIFYKKLFEVYPTIKRQFKTEWCKNLLTNRALPYDFCIEEYKVIIEIDGEQHFKQISNWTSPEVQVEKDKYKMVCANKNGFSVIRLLQQDISKNNYDWVEEIKDNIEKIINENIVQNIFMCKNSEYILLENILLENILLEKV